MLNQKNCMSAVLNKIYMQNTKKKELGNLTKEQITV